MSDATGPRLFAGKGNPYEGATFGLVLGSGLVLFLLGFILSVMLPDYRDSLHAQKYELPDVTALFFRYFARRQSSPFLWVLLWFWWPMLWNWLHCLRRYADSTRFAINFLLTFMLLWGVTFGFLLFVGVVCTFPKIVLLGEINTPRGTVFLENLIFSVSWLFPLVTAAWVVWIWLRKPHVDRPGFPVVPIEPRPCQSASDPVHPARSTESQ
jgi:hypothetical protein